MLFVTQRRLGGLALLLSCTLLLCRAWENAAAQPIPDTPTSDAPAPADTIADTAEVETGEKAYDTIPLRYFFFPRPLEVWDHQWIVGIALTIIPREVAEEELRQAPMIDTRLQFGLPLNFHARAHLATNVLTTYGGLGVGWNVRLGQRFALGADIESSYWYGFANFEGFDITAQGAQITQTLSAGLALNEVLLALHLEAQISAWRRIESDGIDISQGANLISGYGLGVTMEQPLVGRRHISVGIKMNYARQMYQAWLAFATFNEYLLYPEFSLHLLF